MLPWLIPGGAVTLCCFVLAVVAQPEARPSFVRRSRGLRAPEQQHYHTHLLLHGCLCCGVVARHHLGRQTHVSVLAAGGAVAARPRGQEDHLAGGASGGQSGETTALLSQQRADLHADGHCA